MFTCAFLRPGYFHAAAIVGARHAVPAVEREETPNGRA
jgi:hypothetical protein